MPGVGWSDKKQNQNCNSNNDDYRNGLKYQVNANEDINDVDNYINETKSLYRY